MDMKEEMMNDAIDDVMGEDDEEEERYNINYTVLVMIQSESTHYDQ